MSNKYEATFLGKTDEDQHYADIKSVLGTPTPTRQQVVRGPERPRHDVLDRIMTIGSVIAAATFLTLFMLASCAWFFDWKMP